jgi:hypothetical protein
VVYDGDADDAVRQIGLKRESEAVGANAQKSTLAADAGQVHTEVATDLRQTKAKY